MTVSIHSLNKYLLISFYMADIVLGILDTAMIKVSKDPTRQRFSSEIKLEDEALLEKNTL